MDKYLLSAAFLQPVDHFFKLQGRDFHLLLQLIHKRLVLGIQVVVRLLRVQAESCETEQSGSLHSKGIASVNAAAAGCSVQNHSIVSLV